MKNETILFYEILKEASKEASIAIDEAIKFDGKQFYVEPGRIAEILEIMYNKALFEFYCKPRTP